MNLLQIRMIWRLALYVGVVISVSSLVVLLTRPLGLIDLLAHGALSFGTFALGMATLLPMILVVMMPLGAATGVVCCYYDWIKHNEVVAFRMSGASTFSIAVPGIAVALGGMAFTAAMSLYLLPVSFRVFEDIRFAAAHNIGLDSLHEGFNTIEPGLTLAFGQRLSSTVASDVIILDDRDADRWIAWSAQRAQFDKLPRGGMPIVTLDQGEYFSGDRRNGLSHKILFAQSLVPLSSELATRSWRGFFEEHLKGLLFPSAIGSPSATETLLWAAEGHRRIVSPFLCLGYVLFAVGSLLRGGGQRVGGGRRAIIVFAVLVSWQAAIALGHAAISREQQLVPLFYFLALLPSLLGGWLILRADSGTAGLTRSRRTSPPTSPSNISRRPSVSMAASSSAPPPVILGP